MNEFYLQKGYTPVFRHKDFSGAGTAIIWTPTTNTKQVITGLTISSNLGGSIAFYWASVNTKLFEFYVGGSSTIIPMVHIESSLQNLDFVGIPSGGGTNGWKVTAMGFEIPMS